jgi:hypothetical protein
MDSPGKKYKIIVTQSIKWIMYGRQAPENDQVANRIQDVKDRCVPPDTRTNVSQLFPLYLS